MRARRPLFAGVTVVVTDQKSKKKSRSRTDDAGHYSFNGLQDGEYVWELEHPGFEHLQESVVVAGPAAHDLNLRLGSLTEKILVTTDSWNATSGPPAKLIIVRAPKGQPASAILQS